MDPIDEALKQNQRLNHSLARMNLRPADDNVQQYINVQNLCYAAFFMPEAFETKEAQDVTRNW